MQARELLRAALLQPGALMETNEAADIILAQRFGDREYVTEETA
jgi:hypothetical protein